MSTIATSKNILVEAQIAESFDVQVGIYELDKFLGVISLFTDPEFEFGEHSVVISDQNGGSVEYFYCDPLHLTTPTKKITVPEIVQEFQVSEKTLADAEKASRMLGVTELAFRNSENGGHELAVFDIKRENKNAWRTPVTAEKQSDAKFNLVFKTANLKLLPGDYKIGLCSSRVGRFENTKVPITYLIAQETNSTYE